MFTGIKSIHPHVHFRCIVIQLGIVIKQIDFGEVVPLAHLIVIKIVGRSDFYTAGTELTVHVIIGNNRDFTIGEGQGNSLAYKVLVTLIVRVNRNSSITQHGFWTSGGNG